MRTKRCFLVVAGAFVCLAFAACSGDDAGEGEPDPGTDTTGAIGGTGATGTSEPTGGSGATSPAGTTGAPGVTGTTGVTETTGVEVNLEQYPACALVTLDELARETGSDWINRAQPPPSPDQPFCSWDSDPAQQARLQIAVVPGRRLEQCTSSPTAERVRGLGDQAVIDVETRRLCVLSGDRYLSIFLAFFPERDDYVQVATAIAELALPRLEDVPA